MTLDELGELGMARMDGDEIQAFLDTQGVAVLGLAADDGVPYLLPLSYGYDGAETLYFTYLLGEESRKADLTARTERATALVYKADSKYNWESVTLTGTLAELPEAEWDEHAEDIAGAWRPELFEQAAATSDVRVHTFRIEEQTGIKHTGLPPGFADAGGN